MEDLKFTKEIKEQWLEALKSGKYVQGTEMLKKTEEGITKHCCLGVLCEIHPNLSIGIKKKARNEGKEDVVLINGLSMETEIGTDNYKPLNNFIGEDKIRNIASNNDILSDGKYTAVIPIIESIPTIN